MLSRPLCPCDNGCFLAFPIVGSASCCWWKPRIRGEIPTKQRRSHMGPGAQMGETRPPAQGCLEAPPFAAFAYFLSTFVRSTHIHASRGGVLPRPPLASAPWHPDHTTLCFDFSMLEAPLPPARWSRPCVTPEESAATPCTGEAFLDFPGPRLAAVSSLH